MSQFEQPGFNLSAARQGAQGMHFRLDLAFGDFHLLAKRCGS